MKKKCAILIIMIMIIVLLSGCDTSSNSEGNEEVIVNNNHLDVKVYVFIDKGVTYYNAYDEYPYERTAAQLRDVTTAYDNLADLEEHILSYEITEDLIYWIGIEYMDTIDADIMAELDRIVEEFVNQ